MLHAVLDTCVLFRPLLCDTLLCLAEEEMFAPLWSADILAELRRNLLRYGIAEHAVEHRIEQMSIHFPAANVTGYEPLVAGMLISPSDRHVLAAAVRGHADVIVTENVKDFPAEHVELYDVAVSHQDVFLLDLLDLDPVAVRRALTRQVSRYRRQPRTVPELLVALGSAGNGCAGFAAAARAG
jgi:predicted nucleic acid-binding protein